MFYSIKFDKCSGRNCQKQKSVSESYDRGYPWIETI